MSQRESSFDPALSKSRITNQGSRPPGRHLGIDYGTRRVGLAISDEGGQYVSPLDVVEITTPQQAVERVTLVAHREDAKVLVVGLPLNMDDTEGPAAKAVRVWASALAERAKLPVILVDERLSSFDAEQALIARKRGGEHITRKGRKKRLDALAAANFLRGYLDGSLAAFAFIDSPAQAAQSDLEGEIA